MNKLRRMLRKVFPVVCISLLLAACGGSEGLIAHKYVGNWASLPNFTSLTPVAKQTVATVGTHNLGSQHYGLVINGHINIATAGLYRFHLHSDDGSKLYIDGVERINNDGIHAARTVKSDSFHLSAGIHELRVEYFQDDGSQALSLRYQIGNGAIIPVTTDMLSHTPIHDNPNAGAGDSGGEGNGGEGNGGEDNGGGGNGGEGNGGEDCEDSFDTGSSAGDTVTATNSLLAEQQLINGQYLVSENGAYRFYLQSDGNLVLRDWRTRDAMWASDTHGKGGTQVRLQNDGNLVLRNASGNPLWASNTANTTTDRLVLNNNGSLVLYNGDSVEWSVGNEPENNGGAAGEAQCGDDDNGSSGGDGNNNGGEGNASNGRFSTPSAALYSLNDSRRRAFPKYIDSKFGGNGAAETWDGRIFVRTRTDGWFTSTFRPERIGQNSDGSPRFDQGAFGSDIALELNDDVPQHHHNWLAIIPDNTVTTENPYPSDSSGNYSRSNTYKTYKTIIYHTTIVNGKHDRMGFRKATFIVRNADTANAQIESARFTTSFSRLKLVNGSDFRCIEPSVTMDGLLIICQGHPDNNGEIDNLVYSWNQNAGESGNWTHPKSIANMYHDDRNRNIAGLPFSVRFPIAEKPILDAKGNRYNAGTLVKGAYPWISHDGAELFYQASRENMDARRAAASVVGRWTGWAIRHIDGPINRNRSKLERLFLSSPGAFTTMWTPYKDVANLKIPYSVRGPSYPIFGSNSQDYSEVSFDDYLDGNYVLYLGMNEQIDRAGGYLKTRTPDTSGNFNNATMQGAKFPVEFNGKDELVGRYGQGIYFPQNSYLQVSKNQGWGTLVNGVTVDFFLRINNSSSNRVQLFNLQNGVKVYLENGRRLTASLQDTSGKTATISGDNIATGRWVHLAFTYNPFDKNMMLFVDGKATSEKLATGFGSLRTVGSVQVGPANSQGLYIIDEFKVSNLARNAYEIGHNANSDIHRAPSQALVNQIPSYLDSLQNNATAVARFSLAAADLGERLFEDKILSKQRTTSCATCHDPLRTFTDGLAIAEGDEPTDNGTRNTPMLLNRLFSTIQGWSGNAFTLDTQALVPIEAEHEMNLPIAEAVSRLQSDAYYSSQFQQVYGEMPNATNIPQALASFQALQFAPKNRVDDFKEGNTGVLNDSEYRGLILFEGKARCSGCHAGKNFTDESFRSNGLADNGDEGRAEITGRNRDFKLFKVPSLREVRNTAPYMHDGSIQTLRQVVEGYNNADSSFESLDTDIRPLELSNQEITDLVNYLNVL